MIDQLIKNISVITLGRSTTQELSENASKTRQHHNEIFKNGRAICISATSTVKERPQGEKFAVIAIWHPIAKKIIPILRLMQANNLKSPKFLVSNNEKAFPGDIMI